MLIDECSQTTFELFFELIKGKPWRSCRSRMYCDSWTTTWTWQCVFEGIVFVLMCEIKEEILKTADYYKRFFKIKNLHLNKRRKFYLISLFKSSSINFRVIMKFSFYNKSERGCLKRALLADTHSHKLNQIKWQKINMNYFEFLQNH